MARRWVAGEVGEAGVIGVRVRGASAWMVNGVSAKQGDMDMGVTGILLPLFRERYNSEMEENPGASNASVAE